MKSNKFSGKRLLVLGSNVGATDIVEYVRSHGAITMVADYLPPEKSAAKQVADEHFLISTSDLEGLIKLVEDQKIDAVLSGISDFNVQNALLLSEGCKLPFYCTKAQWDLISRKDQFRDLCQRCGVPSPETYYVGEKIPDDLVPDFPYPVVVKPVDASLSMGVFICHSEEEIRYILTERISFISQHYEIVRLILKEAPLLKELGNESFIETILKLIKNMLSKIGIMLNNEEFVLRLLMGSILSFLYMPDNDEISIKNYISKVTLMLLNEMKE